MKELDKLSFHGVMKLYRQKINAEKVNDTQTILILKDKHPYLFSDEFDEFIDNLRLSINNIRNRYGIDYSEIIETEKLIYH